MLCLAVYRISLKYNFKTLKVKSLQLPSIAECKAYWSALLSSLELTGVDDNVNEPGTVQKPLSS